LIREKLAVPQGLTIVMNVLVMNLQKLLELLFILFATCLQLLIGDGEAQGRYSAVLSLQTAA
jgi:hypothetical protein